jgi:hypothetical protein
MKPKSKKQTKSPKSTTGQSKIRGDIVKGKPRGKPFEKGNPGRPLGTKNFKEAYNVIAELLEGDVRFPDGTVRKLRGHEQVALKRYAIALGVKGMVTAKDRLATTQRAMDAIENRVDGLPVQAIKNLGDATGRVSINIMRNLDPKENENVEVKTERTEPTEPKKK